MMLPDVNVLIAAHRAESPQHHVAQNFMAQLGRGPAPFALTSAVLVGFLRIVTHRRVFLEPSSRDEALAVIDAMIAHPGCRMVEPGAQYYQILPQLVRSAAAHGNLISDAHVAAVALEHGCTVASFDVDFRKFPDLQFHRLGQ